MNDPHNRNRVPNEDDDEEDPVEKMIGKTGCLEKHYAIQFCMADHKDWRKCQQEVKDFQTCIQDYNRRKEEKKLSFSKDMDSSHSKKALMENLSITSVTFMATCFLAGIYIGRKLNNTARRVSSLISVGPTKLALVVRDDLKMSKGKIASQCCHGTLVAYQTMERNNPKLLQAWLDLGQPKVVLRGADLSQLKELSEAANTNGIQAVLVVDAGRTQVAEGSETVLAVGPGSVKDVDQVTGKLKLL